MDFIILKLFSNLFNTLFYPLAIANLFHKNTKSKIQKSGHDWLSCIYVPECQKQSWKCHWMAIVLRKLLLQKKSSFRSIPYAEPQWTLLWWNYLSTCWPIIYDIVGLVGVSFRWDSITKQWSFLFIVFFHQLYSYSMEFHIKDTVKVHSGE